MTNVLMRRGGDARRDGSDTATSLGCQQWAEVMKDPPAEASWHRQHLDLRLLDSRISKYLLLDVTQFATALVHQHGEEET